MDAIIKTFIEENWHMYLEHCRSHGLDEEQAEELLEE